MNNDCLLFGDIGGTNARFAYGYFNNNNELIINYSKTYACQNFRLFEEIIDLFLKEHKINKNNISSICFAIGGPVKHGEVKFTNLNWSLSESNIKKHLQHDQVALMNDFAAAGYGIHTLKHEDMHTFNGKHIDNHHNIKSIIGAGTGLGMAHISYNNNQPVINASEGGHIDFAPVGKIQNELLDYLNQKLKRVSVERVLSGYGLHNIYNFLKDSYYADVSQYQSLDEQIQKTPLKTGKIIDSHLDQYQIAKHCQNIFLEIYAQTIANLALTTLPFGGLFVAGGIAPKLKHHFNSEAFKTHMFNKGRMSDLIKEIPMHIILDTNIGLKGAGYYAALKIRQTAKTTV